MKTAMDEGNLSVPLVPVFTFRDPTEILSKDEHLMAKGLLISIAFGANIGGIATITGTPSNLVLMGQIKEIFPLADTGINFISWMVFALPFAITCLLITWLTLVLIFFRNASKGHTAIKDTLRQKYDELPSFSFAEVGISVCFLILLTLWITRDPYIVPDATSAILVAIILFAIPNQKPDFFGKSENVETLLDWKTVQAKFPWSVVLLLGGGFAMAAGVKVSSLGVKFLRLVNQLKIHCK
ncbi:unnamed protein product [Onchocerca flexuosa]|uniref:CitMHS domain-containing protein n=1 Tax=Onchocerca flexuosa TaxID=387005 RepID=A0A183HJ67_9BILA|nr:unnamed protein product [Onchocerca flexuosa]